MIYRRTLTKEQHFNLGKLLKFQSEIDYREKRFRESVINMLKAELNFLLSRFDEYQDNNGNFCLVVDEKIYRIYP